MYVQCKNLNIYTYTLILVESTSICIPAFDSILEFPTIQALVAASDTLGRVLVFDVAAGVLVRMFKGVRDARCAWTQIPGSRGGEEGGRGGRLYLSVYAPAVGVLQVYEMRLGPLVRTMLVGQSAQIHTALVPASCLGCAGPLVNDNGNDNDNDSALASSGCKGKDSRRSW